MDNLQTEPIPISELYKRDKQIQNIRERLTKLELDKDKMLPVTRAYYFGINEVINQKSIEDNLKQEEEWLEYLKQPETKIEHKEEYIKDREIRIEILKEHLNHQTPKELKNQNNKAQKTNTNTKTHQN